MKFRLVILTPYKKYLDSEVESLSLNTNNGEITIYANHENLISNVEISDLKLIINGKINHYAISDGVIEIKHKQNTAILLVSSIESSNEIDIDRAMQSEKDARKLILSAQTVKELSNAEMKLRKALTRISVKEEEKFPN